MGPSCSPVNHVLPYRPNYLYAIQLEHFVRSQKKHMPGINSRINSIPYDAYQVPGTKYVDVDLVTTGAVLCFSNGTGALYVRISC